MHSLLHRLRRRESLDHRVGGDEMGVRIPAEWNKLARRDAGLHARILVELREECVATSGVLAEELGVLAGDLEVVREPLCEGFDVDRFPWNLVLVKNVLKRHGDFGSVKQRVRSSGLGCVVQLAPVTGDP